MKIAMIVSNQCISNFNENINVIEVDVSLLQGKRLSDLDDKNSGFRDCFIPRILGKMGSPFYRKRWGTPELSALIKLKGQGCSEIAFVVKNPFDATEYVSALFLQKEAEQMGIVSSVVIGDIPTDVDSILEKVSSKEIEIDLSRLSSSAFFQFVNSGGQYGLDPAKD